MRPIRPAKNLSALVISCVAAATVMAGCSTSSTPEPSTTLPGSDALQTKMVNLVEYGVPGVVTIVQRGGSSQVLTAGAADLTSNAPMQASSTTRIASVSKPFSAAVILKLASQGALTLQSPIGKLMPSLPKQWQSATISQVLQHTSGIPDYIKDETFLKQFIANPKMERTPQQLINYVADKPLHFTPGSKYEYSDTDNIVAGLIAEQLTKKPYDSTLTQEVLKPLALNNTSLPATTQLPDGAIQGYLIEEPVQGESAKTPENVSEMINPGLAWASGGMIATADDLNLFIRGLLGGKLFNSSVLTAQTAFVPGGGGPPGPGTNSSGLGIYRYQTECGTVFGHTGNMPGYTTFIAASPNGENSVVVAINSQVTAKTSPDLYAQLIAVETQAICTVNPG